MRLLQTLVARIVWLLLLWGAAYPAYPAVACEGLTHYELARRDVLQNGVVVNSEVVSVPDRIPAPWRTQHYQIRYTLALQGCPGADDTMLWIPRVGGPYQVRIDGMVALPTHPVPPQASPRFSSNAQATLNGRTSMLFALPTNARSIEIALQTVPYIPAGLVGVAQGPFQVALPEQLLEFNRQAGGMTVVSVVTTVIGLTAIALWGIRRRYRFILWFGLMCVLWGVRGYFYSSDVIALPPLLFEQVNPATISLFVIVSLQTTLHLLGLNTARRSAALAWTALGFVLAFATSLLLDQGALAVRSAAFGFGMVVLMAIPVLVWRCRQKIGRWSAGLIVLGFFCLVLASLHDILMVAGLLPPDRMSLVLVGFTGLLLAYAVVCVQYVIHALMQAEAVNEILEIKVREKTQALEASYERLRATERLQAQTQERERLLREMHDGLGAQLMTALRGLERNALDKDGISAALQEGIDDLRMLMDNSDPSSSLTDRLAAWRHRWDARLSALGLRLHWQLDDAIEHITIQEDMALQVLRVVQEACANVVKHAQASAIWIRTSVQGQDDAPLLELEVRDNGRGLPSQPVRSGARGLANMRYRAQQIGADIVIENLHPQGSGCRVLLRVPLQPTSPRRAASSVASAREEMPSLR